jgi:hypothetical protein
MRRRPTGALWSAALPLEHDDALLRPRDRLGELGVRVAHGLDALQLERQQEALVADERLDGRSCRSSSVATRYCSSASLGTSTSARSKRSSAAARSPAATNWSPSRMSASAVARARPLGVWSSGRSTTRSPCGSR